MMQIPITIVTGFLGSGKTTLLNQLIIANPELKIVVIENEFGEIGIDGGLLLTLDAQIFEINNGCICCNLNEDLQETLIKILEAEHKPDHLIIETTGIADPSPILASLLNDEIIQSNFTINAIISLVDALHVEKHLNQHPQCLKQISLSNFIVLNKVATLSKPEITKISSIIADLNPEAEIYATNFCDVKNINLLNLNNFEKTPPTNTERKFTLLNNSPYPQLINIPTNTLNHNIQSVSILATAPLDIIKFDTWMKALMGNHFGNIYRVKGMLTFEDFDFQVTLQGVHNTFVTEKGNPLSNLKDHISKIVFIGKNINKALLEEGINLCTYTDDYSNIEPLYDNVEKIQMQFLI